MDIIIHTYDYAYSVDCLCSVVYTEVNLVCGSYLRGGVGGCLHVYVHIWACDAMAITWSCSGGVVLCNTVQLVMLHGEVRGSDPHLITKCKECFSYCCSPLTCLVCTCFKA